MVNHIINEFRNIYKEEGMSGLFRGAKVRVIYLVVAGFVYFGVYEHAKSIVEQTFFK